jgi:hypothetical protein
LAGYFFLIIQYNMVWINYMGEMHALMNWITNIWSMEGG